MAVKQGQLQLKINSCCGVTPKLAFNKKYDIGIYCPRCKRFILAQEGEWILEIVRKWNNL